MFIARALHFPSTLQGTGTLLSLRSFSTEPVVFSDSQLLKIPFEINEKNAQSLDGFHFVNFPHKPQAALGSLYLFSLTKSQEISGRRMYLTMSSECQARSFFNKTSYHKHFSNVFQHNLDTVDWVLQFLSICFVHII